MRAILLIALAAFGLVGCKSSPETRLVASDLFRMEAVYQVLKSEPIPVPQQTPYDGDTRQHESFNLKPAVDLSADGADCADGEAKASNSTPSGPHPTGARRSRFNSLYICVICAICGYNRRF